MPSRQRNNYTETAFTVALLGANLTLSMFWYLSDQLHKNYDVSTGAKIALDVTASLAVLASGIGVFKRAKATIKQIEEAAIAENEIELHEVTARLE